MNARSDIAQHAANLVRAHGFIDCRTFGPRHIHARFQQMVANERDQNMPAFHFMTPLIGAAALALLAGCGEAPQSAQTPEAETAVPAEPAPPSPEAAAAMASVEGWDGSGTAKLGKPLPQFELDKLSGGKVSAESLRGKWTVLALWSASDAASLADEVYIRSVISAADQDPDLDFLSVHVKTDANADPAKAFKGNPWPTLLADEKALQSFGVSALPVYLLVGPDLVIEASRGALAKTPDDGIKPMFRGIAEVKKQVSSPE
jgi:hypothetical protein